MMPMMEETLQGKDKLWDQDIKARTRKSLKNYEEPQITDVAK